MRAVISVVVAVLVLTSCGGGDGPDAPPSAASPTTSAPEAETSSTTTTTHPPAAGFVLDTDYVGEGPRVAVLGDSLAVQSREELRAALPDHALRIAAVRGEGFISGPYSTRWGTPVMARAAEDLGGDGADVAVIALGTNDAWTPDGTVDETLAALDDIVSALGDVCLVAVLVDDASTADGFQQDVAAAIDDRLRATADRVVDWGAIAAEDGVLGDDGIHPTEEGERRWAEAIAAAVRSCPSG